MKTSRITLADTNHHILRLDKAYVFAIQLGMWISQMDIRLAH